jgi:transposase
MCAFRCAAILAHLLSSNHNYRVTDLRRSRYIGLAKTQLQHILCAAAINLYRIVNYIADLPIAHTRPSAFASLAAST